MEKTKSLVTKEMQVKQMKWNVLPTIILNLKNHFEELLSDAGKNVNKLALEHCW